MAAEAAKGEESLLAWLGMTTKGCMRLVVFDEANAAGADSAALVYSGASAAWAAIH
jgi:hypothetical protein